MKIKEVLVSVELWDTESCLSRREVVIEIPPKRPIDLRNLGDAVQRAAAHATDELKNNLENQ